ncbi:MAG TPA: hydrogenase expression/formation protein HypE [Terriglobales bacterium]|nr:hydrogenase expression/formation protein HypE [Terriglobales bacterium]
MADAVKTIAQLSCPAPLTAKDTVLLGHGSGGKLSAELVRDIFLPAFQNPALSRLDDQAIVSVNGSRIAVTTDSFVVKPIFFPGGDIGSLAVHGTVNDLAMGGAQPLFLSAAFIIEEGLSLEVLRRVVASLQQAADACGVQVVTGDTKVVEKGSGDGLFINTTGIGLVPPDLELSANRARPGDKVILSGYIGDHGIAILAQREGLEFESTIESDSAALHTLVAEMLKASRNIRCMRDPTRGGLSSTLNEIAAQSLVGIELEESTIPVREEVRGACEMLGLDPLYVANEGKLVAIVDPGAADNVLNAMRHHPLGDQARITGVVTEKNLGLVTMRTALGTTRIVDMLAGDQLPRIC